MSKVKMPIPVEENVRASRSRHKEASVPQLPPLSINAMTPVQLQEFVPALMKVVMGEYCTRSSGLVHPPHWWPPDVPLWSGAAERNKEGAFTEAMRKVVRNCYHHLGQGALLSAGKLNDWRALIGRVQTRKQTLASGDACTSPGSPELTKSGKKPFVEIYVCFFCSKEFSAKEEMRTHQLGCTKRPQELQSLATPPPATKRNNKPKMKPLSPVPAEKSPPCSPTIEQFLHKFHLIPVSKAKKLRASTRRSTDVDCSKIDFSEPETPISPTTPKTPKLLISQLSRDDSGHCKRRLSYRLQEEHSDSESVVSGSSEDTEDKQPPARNKSLLSIDLSSLLGQRLQKHLKSDNGICVVTNAEAFCKTPVKNQFLEKLRKKENTFPVTYRPRKKTKKRPHVHWYSFTKRQRKNIFKRLKTGLNMRSQILAKSMPKCRVVLGKLSKNSLKYWESRYEKEQKKVACIFPEGPTFLSEDIDKMLGLRKKNRPPKPERSLSLANVVSEDTNAEVLQQKVALYRSLLSDLSSSKEQSLITISPNKTPSGTLKQPEKLAVSMLPPTKDNFKLQERFPQLNSLLQTSSTTIPEGPLTPSSSTSSSPDSSQQLSKQTFCQPLKIEIPTQASLRKPSLRRDLSTNSSHGDVSRECMSPDDSVSIITVSSDEDSFINALCCAGCRDQQRCKCTPVKTDLNGNVSEESKAVSRHRNPLGQYVRKSKVEDRLVSDKKGKDAGSAPVKDEKKTRLQTPASRDDKKSKEHSSVPGDKKKAKEHCAQEDKKLKDQPTESKKSKENKSVVEEKKKKDRSLLMEKKKIKDVKLDSRSMGQYGLRRQASASEGSDKTVSRSQNLVKISAVPLKRPSKLGLRSHNSTPTNSPMRGLKRQASCSPSKSAMPSPKKSKSDLLPRRRCNSVLI